MPLPRWRFGSKGPEVTWQKAWPFWFRCTRFAHVSTCFNIHACRNFLIRKTLMNFQWQDSKGQCFGSIWDCPWLSSLSFDARFFWRRNPPIRWPKTELCSQDPKSLWESLREATQKRHLPRIFFGNTLKIRLIFEPGFMSDGLLLQWKDIFKAPLNCDYLWIDMSCIVSLYLNLLFLMFVGSEPYHRCL